MTGPFYCLECDFNEVDNENEVCEECLDAIQLEIEDEEK